MKPLVWRVWVQATMPSKCLRIILAAGTHDIGAPLPEHGGNDIDLLAVEDVAQVLAVEPGASGALAGRLRDQAVELGARFGGQAITVLEQCPAQSFEAGIVALF